MKSWCPSVRSVGLVGLLVCLAALHPLGVRVGLASVDAPEGQIADTRFSAFSGFWERRDAHLHVSESASGICIGQS
jgi:hypothetical protein